MEEGGNMGLTREEVGGVGVGSDCRSCMCVDCKVSNELLCLWKSVSSVMSGFKPTPISSSCKATT